MKNDIKVIILKIVFSVYLIVSLASCIGVYKCLRDDGNDNNNIEQSSKIEAELGNHILFRNAIINMNGVMRNIMGVRTMNNVIKLDNGYCATMNDKTPHEILELDASNLEKYNDYLSDRGIPLIYVSTPYKIAKGEEGMPLSAKGKEFTNENVDEFIELLNETSVDYVDIREKMNNDNVNQYDYFFRTDHHWNMRGGLYTYSIIENWLCEKLKCQVDENISNVNSYTFENYRKYHLGSCGQRTGLAFVNGADDFEIVIPNYNVYLEKSNNTLITDFIDYYDKDQLLKKSYKSSFYDRIFKSTTFGYSNKFSRNDKKILVIGDSMAMTVYPFLALGFKEVNFIWHSSDKSELREYIENYKPDAVVIIYYPIELNSGANYCFDFGM